MSIALDIPDRPFATENLSGLMLPDGIFVTTLGQQGINASVRNRGSSASSAATVYLESVDDPAIVFSPATYPVPSLVSGASKLLTWQADFSGAKPGKHLISFVVSSGTQTKRILARVFVTTVTFDSSTKTFTAVVPEGSLGVRFIDLVGSTMPCGCDCKTAPPPGCDPSRDVVQRVARAFAVQPKEGVFKLCVGGFLIHEVVVDLAPDPPYAGQYGDLPFSDPFWKIILAIIAALLAIAAAVAQALAGGGDLTVSGGTSGGGEMGNESCCGVQVSGGGNSYVAAGLLAAAAAVATVAALSDARDPFRRGQDNTNPAPGALTTGESLQAKISYLEPVEFGKPFAIGAKWRYTRVTTAGDLSYAVDEIQNNIHVLSSYEITAPNVVRTYEREPFVVKGVFRGPDGTVYKGDELFVQCFLIGPAGQLAKFLMEDNGLNGRLGDAVALDGIYTGGYQFTEDDRGIWTFLVIAQDINDADASMTPDEAAQIIGGMVLTHQLTINFEGGTCPYVPDGHVHVV
jgi:hypothetical protein